MESDILTTGAIWYVVFLFSTTFHEFAHAFTALKLGEGTLDPWPNIKREPVGMVLVPIVLLFVSGGNYMMGWASAPYDPFWAARHPKRAALMGLAGPASNLALFIISILLIYIGIQTNLFCVPEYTNFTQIVDSNIDGLPKGLAMLISIFFSLNLLLFVFNMIPIAPLDGTSLMEFILDRRTIEGYRNLMAHPQMRMFGLFIAWKILDVIFAPVHSAAVNMVYFPYGYTFG